MKKNILLISALLIVLVSKANSKELKSQDSSGTPSTPDLTKNESLDSITSDLFDIAVVSSQNKNSISKKVSKSQELVKDSVSVGQSSVASVSVDSEGSTSSDSTPMSAALMNNINMGNGSSKFNGNAQFSISTDFNDTSDPDKVYYTQFAANLGYRISSKYRAIVRVDVQKDLSSSFEEQVNDTRVSLAKNPTKPFKNMLLAPSAVIVLPTSENSGRRDDMNFALEFSPAMIFNISDVLSFTYLPRARYNNYEFTTSRDNRALDQFRFLQFFVLGYSITDRLSVSPTLILSNRWSHTGKQQSPAYLTNIDFWYMINKKYNISFGTLTGGSLFNREAGPNQGVEVFDSNTTEFYTSLGMIF